MDIQLKQKKGLKKKHIPYILGGVLLLFIMWLILGDHSSTLVIDSRTITVGTAKNDLFNDYIRVNGTVQPITILQLSPLEGGVVEKRNIEEGNTVKEGDVILTLSNQNLSASVLESESQLADRVNALRNAQIQMEQDRLNQQKEQFATDLDIQRKKRQYQQKEKLYNEKLIAREEYLQAKEDYELVERSRELIIERQKQDSLARAVQIDHLKENVENMNKNMELIRQRVENLKVKSPIDGELVQLNVEVHPGLDAKFERQGVEFGLKVSKVYPEVQGGQFKIDFHFEGERPDNIWSGQTYYINLELGQPVQALLIPRGAFYQLSLIHI